MFLRCAFPAPPRVKKLRFLSIQPLEFINVVFLNVETGCTYIPHTIWGCMPKAWSGCPTSATWTLSQQPGAGARRSEPLSRTESQRRPLQGQQAPRNGDAIDGVASACQSLRPGCRSQRCANESQLTKKGETSPAPHGQ